MIRKECEKLDKKIIFIVMRPSRFVHMFSLLDKRWRNMIEVIQVESGNSYNKVEDTLTNKAVLESLGIKYEVCKRTELVEIIKASINNSDYNIICGFDLGDKCNHYSKRVSSKLLKVVDSADRIAFFTSRNDNDAIRYIRDHLDGRYIQTTDMLKGCDQIMLDINILNSMFNTVE